MKHPTHIVHSSGFYGPMCKMFFNYTTGFEEYATMSANFAKHIPGAKLDALLLDDSSHTDQGDISVYNSFMNCLLFNKLMSKCSFTKKGGNGV